MSRAVPVLPWLAVSLALAGCPKNKDDPFPLSVGFQPLSSLCVTADWPAPVTTATGTDYFPEVLSVKSAPNCGGMLSPDNWVITGQAHARGYFKKDILTVWARMRPAPYDPVANWVHLCDTTVAPAPTCVSTWVCEPGLEAASFPVSFRMLYHVSGQLVSVDWEHTWREGPLAGTVADPLNLVVGARYQKTWGIENIRVQAGSFVLKAVGPAGAYTSIEMVGWLDADALQSPADVTVAGTLQNAYNLLRVGTP